jgi:peptidyl-prolyl cis-trans isomerase SurA
VRTQFGYHIIKVERVRGAEVQARHILIRHEITEAGRGRARARADTVPSGCAPAPMPPQLARQYGDRDEPVRQGPTPLEFALQTVGVDLSTHSRAR